MGRSYNLHIAVQHPPFRTLIYKHHQKLPEGVRVQVPMLTQACVGVVVEPPHSQERPEEYDFEIRSIVRVLDDEPIFSPTMIQLAHFLSHYYIHPLGDVYRTMLPGTSTKAKTKWRFCYHPDHKPKEPLTSYGHETLEDIFSSSKNNNTLTHITFKNHLKKLKANHPDFQPEEQTRLWLSLGYLSKEYISSEISSEKEPPPLEPPKKRAKALKKLTPKQSLVFKSISTDIKKGFTKPWLLHGITGSGKTEVYLHLIHHLLKAKPKAQVLVMVPEISLTPQITRIFKSVFFDQVAMIHSNLTSQIRWSILQSVRRKEKNILIGPRSSIFAPFQNLKLIIIDEEHDSSYKQGSGLHYHGRDVAIYRAQLENSAIVLGSATPSLETYYHTTTGKFHKATLDQRASGGQLPSSSLELSPTSKSKGQILKDVKDFSKFSSQPSPLAPAIAEALQENFKKGFQSMVMVQRRGYAHFLLDFDSQKTVMCPRCSVSLSVHLESESLVCHYCDLKKDLKEVIQQQNTTVAAVGYGSEKATDLLQHLLPQARIQRLDSDLPSLKTELPKILENFKNREVDILVGTQMIAKGHDFPAVTLTALLEVDDLLRLPDFRAGERVFQLIVQASGRSGRGEHPGKVMIQSTRSHHPIISEALAQDYLRFYKREITHRSLFRYPPFTKIILIEFSHKNLKKLENLCEDLQDYIMEQKTPPTLRILGPSIPPLAMIKEQQRRTLMVISSELEALHHYARRIHKWLQDRRERIQIRIDVDPLHLL